MSLGIEIENEQLQPYLRDGKEFDLDKRAGQIAAAAREYLPPPGSITKEQLQKRFVLPSPSWEGRQNPFAYIGFKDMWLVGSKLLPGFEGMFPAVVDFKTTSNLNQYAKDENDLRTDVQANLYAMNALIETDAKAVDLVWLYMRTRDTPKAKRTHLRVYPEQVAEQFAAIDETGQQIATLKETVTDPLTLPPNPEACSKYGGCPYQHKCNLSPTQKLFPQGVNVNMQSSAALLKNLRVRAGAPAEPLGINPPEKDLPPPSPPLTVDAHDGPPPTPETPAPTQASVAEAVQKRKPGRPPGTKNRMAVVQEKIVSEYAETFEKLAEAEATEVRPVLIAALRAAAQAFLDATGGR